MEVEVRKIFLGPVNVLRASGAPNRTCRKPHARKQQTAREDIRRPAARRGKTQRPGQMNRA